MTIEEGWYPDPDDESQIRYWDGEDWTERTAPREGANAPGTEVGPPPPPPPPGESRWADDEPEGDQPTAATEVQPGPKHRRWPLILAAIAVLLIASGAVYLLLGSGDDADAEVILQPVASTGQDPFTDSVANMKVDELTSNGENIAGDPVEGVEGGGSSVESVSGSTPGLYGGTENESVCDPQAMIDFLKANPDKAQAWADAQGISVDQIPDFVHSLTPVILREDTRVTNHGFVDGTANPFQAVLQAGTAVLIDDHGVPRARCACGNPLSEPMATPEAPNFTGDSWDNFDQNRTVAVSSSDEVVKDFELVDVVTGRHFKQPAGGGGGLTVDKLINLKIPTFECADPNVRWRDGVHPQSGTDPEGFGIHIQISVAGAGDDSSTSEGLQAKVGDLDDDGVDDGAVITEEYCGGNTVFPHLIAFHSDGSGWGELPVADSTSGFGASTISNLEIVDGGIEVDTTSLGPGDPRATPSVEDHLRFEWGGQQWVLADGSSSSGDTGDEGDDTTAPTSSAIPGSSW